MTDSVYMQRPEPSQGSDWRVATPLLPPARHDVQFYNDDAALCSEVADFLAEGIIAGQPVIVVATAEHRHAFWAELRARGVDVDSPHSGVIWLDAGETLSTFMEGSRPGAGLFMATVGTVLKRAMASRPGALVRAYGEMVDVLWRQGKSDAALDLEELWNALGRKYRFSLRCAYSRNALLAHPRDDGVECICAQHSTVLPSPTR